MDCPISIQDVHVLPFLIVVYILYPILTARSRKNAASWSIFTDGSCLILMVYNRVSQQNNIKTEYPQASPLFTTPAYMTTKLWLLYIGKILVTINTVNAIDSLPCIMSTVAFKAKSIGPRDESHSCFACHCLAPLAWLFDYDW